MYIVAIAWIYVLLMVSIMQPTLFRGIVTFIGAGVGPLALVLWLVGTPRRRLERSRREAEHDRAAGGAGSGQPDQ